MGMLKSWRSSPVCKTGGYAFGGPNPPMPTKQLALAQPEERTLFNVMRFTVRIRDAGLNCLEASHSWWWSGLENRRP